MTRKNFPRFERGAIFFSTEHKIFHPNIGILSLNSKKTPTNKCLRKIIKIKKKVSSPATWCRLIGRWRRYLRSIFWLHGRRFQRLKPEECSARGTKPGPSRRLGVHSKWTWHCPDGLKSTVLSSCHSLPKPGSCLTNWHRKKTKFLRNSHFVDASFLSINCSGVKYCRLDWNLRITVIWPREAANLSLMATNFWNQMFSPSNVAVHYLPGTAATR